MTRGAWGRGVAVVGFLAAWVLGGCGGEPSQEWAGVVRDSAGIRIVENRGPGLWGPDEGWRVEETLRIGGDDARPETLFGRVADLEVDGDGRIYVLDAQASEIRVFGPDGTSVGVVGSPGRGPGELGPFASGVILLGADTLLVPDWSQGRLNRYSRSGAFMRASELPGPAGARSWWALGPDGALRARVLTRFVDDAGRWGGRDVLVRVTPEGAVRDTVLVFEYRPSDLGGPGEPRVPLAVNAPSWTGLPDGGVAWASLEGSRIRIHDAGGALVGLVGRDAWTGRPPSQPTLDTLTALLGEKLASLGGNPAAVEQMELVPPSASPAISAVRAGPRGTLWVQRPGAAADVHPWALNGPDLPEGFVGADWDVLDADGRFLGTVTLPAPTLVFRIRSDAVYGVHRDSLGVEHVVRLELRMP